MSVTPTPRVCPRCRGSMIMERDWYGAYSSCIACGYVHEVLTTPAPIRFRSAGKNGFKGGNNRRIELTLNGLRKTEPSHARRHCVGSHRRGRGLHRRRRSGVPRVIRAHGAKRAAVRASRFCLRLSELRRSLPHKRGYRGRRLSRRSADSRAAAARWHRADE